MTRKFELLKLANNWHKEAVELEAAMYKERELLRRKVIEAKMSALNACARQLYTALNMVEAETRVREIDVAA